MQKNPDLDSNYNYYCNYKVKLQKIQVEIHNSNPFKHWNNSEKHKKLIDIEKDYTIHTAITIGQFILPYYN